MRSLILISFIILTFFSSFLAAEELEENCIQPSSRLYYFKYGFNQQPGNSESFLASIGLGTRFHTSSCDFDLSLNASSLIIHNCLSAKTLFLCYPASKLYLGCGPSLSCIVDMPIYGRSKTYGLLALEGVVGYEFQHNFFKTFIQIEMTQPAVYIDNRSRKEFIPTFGLFFGTGF